MSNAPFLERARLEREQERDASARLALGGYVVARLVERSSVATACYAAAADAAEEIGDLVIVLRSRLGRSAVLRGEGNLPLAQAMVEEVARVAARAHLREVEAMAHTDLGAVLAL